MKPTQTYTHKEIRDLLELVDEVARGYDSNKFGQSLHRESVMSEIQLFVVAKLGLTIMEDERILTIQKHTGCTRAQAQSLIDSISSGEF